MQLSLDSNVVPPSLLDAAAFREAGILPMLLGTSAYGQIQLLAQMRRAIAFRRRYSIRPGDVASGEG